MAKKEMDQLTKDAVAARKAGMTYGKYIAMTKPVNTVPEEEGYRHTCAHCGVEFITRYRRLRKFCSDQCRYAYYSTQKQKGAQNDG